jgi:hypothetical protein
MLVSLYSAVPRFDDADLGSDCAARFFLSSSMFSSSVGTATTVVKRRVDHLQDTLLDWLGQLCCLSYWKRQISMSMRKPAEITRTCSALHTLFGHMQEPDIGETPLPLRINGTDSDGTFEQVEVLEVRLSIACDMSQSVRSSRALLTCPGLRVSR